MSSRLENNKLTLGNVEITSDLLIPSFTFQSVNVTNTSTSIHLNMDEGYEYVVFKDGNIVDIDISENVTLEVGKYVIVGVKGSINNWSIIDTSLDPPSIPTYSFLETSSIPTYSFLPTTSIPSYLFLETTKIPSYSFLESTSIPTYEVING